jgi:hypothetical protein
MLTASAQNPNNNGNHQGGGNNGNGVGNSSSLDNGDFDLGDPDEEPSTQVPFDDYVPFLLAGAVVYGVWVNQKKKIAQA